MNPSAATLQVYQAVETDHRFHIDIADRPGWYGYPGQGRA
jgi:hypothetical protein